MENNQVFYPMDEKKSKFQLLSELVADCDTVEELEQLEESLKLAVKENLLPKDHFKVLHNDMVYRMSVIDKDGFYHRKDRDRS
jgi:hypothetical protein